MRGRVAESQKPFLVKIGVRSWKARREPVGRRFAKWAVLVRPWESARCAREGGSGWDFGVPEDFSSLDVELPVVVVGAISDTDVCLEGVCLALRDIL